MELCDFSVLTLCNPFFGVLRNRGEVIIKTKTDSAILIFAKTPIPGKVKTRMSPPLTMDEAAELYKCMFLDTIVLTKGISGLDIFLFTYPSSDDPLFKRLSREYSLTLMDQGGDNLGERMKNAMDKVFSAGYKKVIIIGSDSPDIPASYIKDAFSYLDEHDIVIGPSRDGGYYLIGGSKVYPDIFDSIPWGTDKVMEMTMARISAGEISCKTLPIWYDIDCAEDLLVLIDKHCGSRNVKNISPDNTIQFVKSCP